MNQRRQTPRAGRGKPQHSGKSASWMGGTDSGQGAPARGGPIRIAVVDDDNAVLQSLTAYLATAPDIKLVGMGTTGFEAVRLATKHHPDILMTDVRMPIMDGISAVEQVRLLAPDVKVVLLTTFDDDEAMLAGLQAGASGFLLKNTSPEDLVGGLRQVAAGGTVVSPGPTGHPTFQARNGRPGTAVPGLFERRDRPEALRPGIDGEVPSLLDHVQAPGQQPPEGGCAGIRAGPRPLLNGSALCAPEPRLRPGEVLR